MATIFLIGDSTVTDNEPPFRGWGWALPEFTAAGVRVENHAVSGRSTLSFLQENRFAPVLAAIRPGDALMIQFGHNDEKEDVERHTNAHTTYPDLLAFYCDAAAERGARPVLCTPVSRRFFTGDGGLLYTHGEYAGAVRRLAAEKGVPLCDLERMTRELYLGLGEQGAAKLFVELAPGEHPDFPDGHRDLTHFNADGARAVARLAARWMAGEPRCADLVKPSTQS